MLFVVVESAPNPTSREESLTEGKEVEIIAVLVDGRTRDIVYSKDSKKVVSFYNLVHRFLIHYPGQKKLLSIHSHRKVMHWTAVHDYSCTLPGPFKPIVVANQATIFIASDRERESRSAELNS